MRFYRDPLLAVKPLSPGQPISNDLMQALFLPPLGCFALLDGAQTANLPELIAASGLQHDSLFDGDARGIGGDAGPWLVALDPSWPFSKHLLTRTDARWHLWGRTRPVLIRTALPFDALRQHLRRFVRMRLDSGAMPFFRFWDAMILSDYFEGCAALPDRAARFFGRDNSRAPLIDSFWLKPDDDRDRLVPYRITGPLPALPGQSFDSTDLAILQAGVDRRLIQKLTPKLHSRFAKIAPDQADNAKSYATGALAFVRQHGAGQSLNTERDCMDLALVAFLLGPSWDIVRKGPLLTNPLVPISQRIALLRESYFEALTKVPPPSTPKET